MKNNDTFLTDAYFKNLNIVIEDGDTLFESFLRIIEKKQNAGMLKIALMNYAEFKSLKPEEVLNATFIKNGHKFKLLTLAAYANNFEAVKFFVGCGADVNGYTFATNNSPLEGTALNAALSNIDIQVKDYSISRLGISKAKEHAQIIKFLLERNGLSLTSKDANDLTLKAYMAEFGNVRTELLVEMFKARSEINIETFACDLMIDKGLPLSEKRGTTPTKALLLALISDHGFFGEFAKKVASENGYAENPGGLWGKNEFVRTQTGTQLVIVAANLLRCEKQLAKEKSEWFKLNNASILMGQTETVADVLGFDSAKELQKTKVKIADKTDRISIAMGVMSEKLVTMAEKFSELNLQIGVKKEIRTPTKEAGTKFC